MKKAIYVSSSVWLHIFRLKIQKSKNPNELKRIINSNIEQSKLSFIV